MGDKWMGRGAKGISAQVTHLKVDRQEADHLAAISGQSLPPAEQATRENTTRAIQTIRKMLMAQTSIRVKKLNGGL